MYEPKLGRPRKTTYDQVIAELAAIGWGRRRIYELLAARGAHIGMSTIARRLRELRTTYNRTQGRS